MSSPKSSQQWILSTKPTHLPELSGSNQTFKLVEKDLPNLKDDQLLVKTLYLSNDPAQRGWISKGVNPDRLYTLPVKEGTPMHARGLCEVLESTSENFKKGDTVLGSCGWTEYSVLDAKACQPAPELPAGLSKTHYLGALGLTGLTAYYGLKVVSEAKPEHTVVVSGAAGATGMMVVQIAKKIIGCKTVIGMAGSDEKCKYVESLGADKCLNYKSKTFKEDLIKLTPGPHYVDVYFDNVGGEILDFMFTRMGKGSVVAACGAISDYNTPADKWTGLKNWYDVIVMRIQIRGFIVLDYLNKTPEVMGIFQQAIKDGKLSIGDESEQVVKGGFKDVPKTWMTLFEGGNTGKLVTQII